jgi:hypothetical protein
MQEETRKSKVEKLAKSIAPHLFKIEIVFAIVIFIALIINVSSPTIAQLALIISLALMAMVYYVVAFQPLPEDSSSLDRFFFKLMNLGFSVAMISILFSLNRYPAAKLILEITLVLQAINILVLLIAKLLMKKLEKFSNAEIIRVLIITGLVAVVYFSSEVIGRNL